MVNLRVVKMAATVAVVGVTMSACVVVPRPYASYPSDPSYPSAGGYGDAPQPPAPRYEVVPLAPFLGAIWIAGFWNWHAGRHIWVPGRWSHPHHRHHHHGRYR